MLPRVIRIYKDEGSEEEEDAELDAVKLFTINEAKRLAVARRQAHPWWSDYFRKSTDETTGGTIGDTEDFQQQVA